MTSTLSSLVDNLAEGIHRIKCKHEHDNKKCETCGIQYKDCESCLDLILYKCLCRNRNYQKNLKKR